MKSKIFLCAFASPDLFLSKRRFYNQAKSLNFYKGIKIYEKRELSTNSHFIKMTTNIGILQDTIFWYLF